MEPMKRSNGCKPYPIFRSISQIKRGSVIAAMIITLILSSRMDLANAQGGEQPKRYFLPLIVAPSSNAYRTDTKLFGIYLQQYWTDQNVSTYMTQADNLAGNKKHSVSGWFIDIQDLHFANPPANISQNNLYRQLDSLWKKGYVSFVNINSTASSYSIASGQLDSYLNKMADTYAAWIRLGGGRRAFIALLPEMNGVNSNGSPWATYGGDPANFMLAYQRIQNIFAKKGITRDNVWWVFAPNGWSKDGHEFEKYYPGDAIVDVVAFSSYNYGHCFVAIPWQSWDNYDTLYQPYLSRIGAMAPNKPIIVAQTGTTGEYQQTGVIDVNAKNSWLQLNYEYLAQQPQVLGVLYYDYDQSGWECNWKITSGGNFTGYRDGLGTSAYQYISSQDLQSIIP
jgi:hypothetical protein